uniref:Reverse transcriptase domain-containing protein n=1 Tax=Macrostomum lignano TaxID=282301 RepID=A0A1I8FUS7_9PLAT
TKLSGKNFRTVNFCLDFSLPSRLTAGFEGLAGIDFFAAPTAIGAISITASSARAIVGIVGVGNVRVGNVRVGIVGVGNVRVGIVGVGIVGVGIVGVGMSELEMSELELSELEMSELELSELELSAVEILGMHQTVIYTAHLQLGIGISRISPSSNMERFIAALSSGCSDCGGSLLNISRADVLPSFHQVHRVINAGKEYKGVWAGAHLNEQGLLRSSWPSDIRCQDKLRENVPGGNAIASVHGDSKIAAILILSSFNSNCALAAGAIAIVPTGALAVVHQRHIHAHFAFGNLIVYLGSADTVKFASFSCTKSGRIWLIGQLKLASENCVHWAAGVGRRPVFVAVHEVPFRVL